jgi:hypothetical protein
MPSLVRWALFLIVYEIYNAISHLILNDLGKPTLILGSSNYRQQICAVRNSKDINYLLVGDGDIKFGANMSGELFKRKKWPMKFWILLLVTSCQLMLCLTELSDMRKSSRKSERHSATCTSRPLIGGPQH